ncbi:ABC transporter related protein [Coriobacterium glomerans PW2]|uniref:ABC transporter related protein n=1 Tax=Coriobacterium glomerans (strain ATCC 49209 / DSM 20642 / JCM 10262 / PW2) TaxID=700015 RepID=F2NAE9_CORGP|nr:energy-coupling factor transporter ATPase [Coriobacterium glomerans]AEB06335.1 ABC transporter related protein [Coriobacterium glomerans PW2]
MSEKPQISLRDVCFRYGGDTDAAGEVLDGISLDIRAGEHVCVLGANGSGKSTLIQLMNALLVPTRGSVRVFGISATDTCGAMAIRRRAAMVFQHPDDQMVTSIVADDVAFGPENLGVPQPEIVQRVDSALDAVDMSTLAQADPSDLSGGQRQRVAVAGALAMNPELLLLDEPSAMLDGDGRLAIRDIIEALSARGITVVHVTHFMDEAIAADRAIVLDHGRITLDGTPEEVFSHRQKITALGLELPFAIKVLDGLERLGLDVPFTMDLENLAGSIAPLLGTTCSEESQTIAEGREQTGASDRFASCGARPAIEFDHVSFSYERPRDPRRRRLRLWRRAASSLRAPLALDDVSFSVEPGSLTALIGRTGAGKSTCIELACALKVPLVGTVRVGGIDTTDLAQRGVLRQQIGYISQFPERQLFAETVYEDVAFGPRNLHLADSEVDDRVRAALEAVGLEDWEGLLGRSPFALSGGQQRSVAIAGVLALRSSMLVLDEPMAGLDPRGRARMRKLVSELKARGTTLLLVTHSMDDAAELADEVIVLREGKRCEQGTPKRVFTERDLGLGAPAALGFSRSLRAHGAHGIADALTLSELMTEVSYGLAR